MRASVALAFVIGCGGGASIITDPQVEITSRSCSVQTTDLVVVNVDYLVSLDVGQAFEATVDVIGNANPTMINNTFSCGLWSFSIPDDRGCQRDSLSQPESTTITHFYNSLPDPLPVPTQVQILGSALLVPNSDSMLANDSDTLTCIVAAAR